MITHDEYLLLKTKQAIYEDWAKQYQRKNGWTVIPKDATPPNSFDNADRSAIEVYEFKNDPPDKYFLYIKEPPLGNIGDAHTWTGESLGACHFGREYRGKFGGRCRSVVVYGINGRTYAGTYFKSSGDYAQIKALKVK